MTIHQQILTVSNTSRAITALLHKQGLEPNIAMSACLTVICQILTASMARPEQADQIKQTIQNIHDQMQLAVSIAEAQHLSGRMN